MASWQSELEAMQLDCAPDAAQLEAACVNYASAVKAHIKLEREGEVIREAIVAQDKTKILGYRTKKNPLAHGSRTFLHTLEQVLFRVWILSGGANAPEH
jgi:hypothetical protein